jgi:hypothetical protein
MDPPVVYNNLIPIPDGYYSDDNFEFDPEFDDSYPYNCHLSPQSEAINAGVMPDSLLSVLPDTDIDGNIRVDSIDQIIDLGAWEADPTLHVASLENTNTFKVQVLSNPAVEVVEIEICLPETCEAKVEIINIQGKLVYTMPNRKFSQGRHQIQTHLGHLDPGIYLLCLRTKTSLTSAKLMLLTQE